MIVQALAAPGPTPSEIDDRQAVRISSLAHALDARIRAALGDRPGAREAWNRSLAAIAPVAERSDDHQFLEPWAFALLETGRTTEALAVIRKLAAMQFHNPLTRSSI